MDIDILKQFLSENFNGGKCLLDIAEFINLSKEDQALQIKDWAISKAQTLNDEKINLEIIKTENETRIDSILAKLDELP